jgi:Tfp pilus assembly PilM family ATPase
MKVEPYRFPKIRTWFGPSSFSALHISREYLYFIKLKRNSYDLEYDSHMKIRIHLGAISRAGIQNENQLRNALEEMKKKVGKHRVVLVIPASSEISGYSLREVKREKDVYRKIVAQSGFGVSQVLYEEEALRAKLTLERRNAPEIFVHIGAREANISLVSKGAAVYSKPSAFGGELLALAIAKTFGISEHDGEVIKNEKGMKSGADGRVVSIIGQASHILKDDIERAAVSWHEQMKKVSGLREAVSNLTLAGSESMLPGLEDYLSHALRMRVEYMDVWNGVLDTETHLPALSRKESLDYAYAIGGVFSSL